MLFQNGIPDERHLETTDEGQELYEVFFKYQYQLYRGQKKGNFEEAHKYEVTVLRKGIRTIRFKFDHGASAQGSARGRDSEVGCKGRDNQCSSRRQSGIKKPRHQVEIGTHADAGLAYFSDDDGYMFRSYIHRELCGKLERETGVPSCDE